MWAVIGIIVSIITLYFPFGDDNSNFGLTYRQISGNEFSGESGEINRTIYFPNAKEFYYSGMKLLNGEDWDNKENYLVLYIPIWNDQIIEIGY